jgi:hypothetical protein
MWFVMPDEGMKKDTVRMLLEYANTDALTQRSVAVRRTLSEVGEVMRKLWIHDDTKTYHAVCVKGRSVSVKYHDYFNKYFLDKQAVERRKKTLEHCQSLTLTLS